MKAANGLCPFRCLLRGVVFVHNFAVPKDALNCVGSFGIPPHAGVGEKKGFCWPPVQLNTVSFKKKEKKRKDKKGSVSMAFLILALQICDLCQQREKCFSMKAKKINLSPPFTVGFCNRGHVFISSCQPHKYLCLMNKSETKERAAGYRARESAHTVTQFHCARGSSFHPAPHSTCILRTAGFETDMSTHFQSREMFQSNGRLPRRLAGGGWERGESSLRLSHADGSNHMFLSFKKRPGGDVC